MQMFYFQWFYLPGPVEIDGSMELKMHPNVSH